MRAFGQVSERNLMFCCFQCILLMQAGPPVGELLEILGKEESAARLQLALEEYNKSIEGTKSRNK